MKELISRQLVKYLEARGVEHVFGLCGHTNIAVLAEMAKSRIKGPMSPGIPYRYTGVDARSLPPRPSPESDPSAAR